jgi:hypothetical protein
VACRGVPQACGTVVSTGGELLASGLNTTLMTLTWLSLRVASGLPFSVPQACGAVGSTGGELLAIGTEHHASNSPLVTFRWRFGH